jgi:hypothetical protein
MTNLLAAMQVEAPEVYAAQRTIDRACKAETESQSRAAVRAVAVICNAFERMRKGGRWDLVQLEAMSWLGDRLAGKLHPSKRDALQAAYRWVRDYTPPRVLE